MQLLFRLLGICFRPTLHGARHGYASYNFNVLGDMNALGGAIYAISSPNLTAAQQLISSYVCPSDQPIPSLDPTTYHTPQTSLPTA